MNKLQQTAKRCLEVLGTFELDMKHFRSEECGTTFCLAGYLAHLDGYPSEYQKGCRFNYCEYSGSLIGYSFYMPEWGFMFGTGWSNDLELARKRMEYVIEHGSVPDGNDWKDFGWSCVFD